MRYMKRIFAIATTAAGMSLLAACSQVTRDWPLEKDIAPLLQQTVQMSVGMSFDGSLSKVVKVEVTDIKCNDLEKGKVGCSYFAKVTIHKFARGASTPEVKTLQEKLSGSFVRRGDLWARG